MENPNRVLDIGGPLPRGWWWAETGRLLVGCHPALTRQRGGDPWGVLHGAGIRRRISLVEPAEVVGLPDLAEPDWLDTRSFPIADYGVPDAASLKQFVLTVGFGSMTDAPPLFIHCMGGCGRSGIMAAALLVAGGFCPAGDIQARLDLRRRQAGLEPCCPETPAQRAFIADLADLAGPA